MSAKILCRINHSYIFTVKPSCILAANHILAAKICDKLTMQTLRLLSFAYICLGIIGFQQPLGLKHAKQWKKMTLQLSTGSQITIIEQELSKLTVVKLKEKCKELQVPVGGVKAELIARIIAKSRDLLGSEQISSEQQLVQSAPKETKKIKPKTVELSVSIPLPVTATTSALSQDEDELDMFMSIGASVMKEKGLGDMYMSDSRRVIEANNGRPLVMAPRGNVADAAMRDQVDATREAIEELLRARATARSDRDFTLADSVRAELESKYQVSLFDRDGRWQDADGRVGYYQQLNKAPVVRQATVTLSKEEIQTLVDNRIKARRSRNFQLADELREQLAQSGVELFDKLNTWQTVDGKMEGMQSNDEFKRSGKTRWPSLDDSYF